VSAGRPSARRSSLFYAAVLPVAALTGATAVHGVETAVFLGVGFIGALVVIVGSMTSRPALVGRIVLWAGVLISLGIKPPRRIGDEVISTPLVFANTAPVLALVVAIGAALLLCRVSVFPLTRSESWLAVFLAAAVASSLWSVSPAHSALRAVTLVACYVAMLVLARTTEDERVDPLAELDAIVHLLIATVVIGLVLAPEAALSAIPGSLTPVGRLKGTLLYIHPNALAFLAVIGIVIAVSGKGLRPVRERWMSRVALVAFDSGILLATRTRSALVLVVLAAALAALLDDRTRRRLVVLAPAIAALAFVILQLGGASVAGFVAREQTAEQLTGLTGRVEEWDRAIQVTMASPLIGQGYYAGHRFGALAELEGDLNTTTDNAWIDVAIDLGIAGLVPLVAFVATGLVRLVRAKRRRDGRADVTLVVFAVCAAASFVNPSLNESNYWMLVFGFTVLALAPALDRTDVADAADAADNTLQPERVEPPEPPVPPAPSVFEARRRSRITSS